MHKATALVRHVQTDSMNTSLLYYSFPQNHVCPIYWEDKLSKLGTAFVPATQSCIMFPAAGRWSLNWSLDTNIYNLPVQTNVTHTHTQSPLASAAPELGFGMSPSTSWACTGQLQQGKDAAGTRMHMLYVYKNIQREWVEFKKRYIFKSSVKYGIETQQPSEKFNLL